MDNGADSTHTKPTEPQEQSAANNGAKDIVEIRPSSVNRRRNLGVALAFIPFACLGGGFIGAGIGGAGATPFLIGLGVILVGGVVISLLQGKPQGRK